MRVTSSPAASNPSANNSAAFNIPPDAPGGTSTRIRIARAYRMPPGRRATRLPPPTVAAGSADHRDTLVAAGHCPAEPTATMSATRLDVVRYAVDPAITSSRPPFGLASIHAATRAVRLSCVTAFYVRAFGG